jgi:hypothetical protein
MRNSGKWIAVVLILFVAGLVGTVSAQKGKPTPPPTPTYVWEISLPTVNDLADIYGPGIPFNAASGASIDVSVNPPDPKSGYVGASFFQVDATDGAWLAFRNFKVAIPAAPFGPCVYPLFDSEGFMTAGTSAPASGSCVVDFLSAGGIGHKHPSGTYGKARVQLAVLGLDFRDVSPSGSMTVTSGSLRLAVYRDQSCYSEADPYSGVALAGAWQDGTITIHRSADGDTWTFDFSLPAPVYEFVPPAPTVTRRGTSTTCYSQLVAETTTEPIHGIMTVTRKLQ